VSTEGHRGRLWGARFDGGPDEAAWRLGVSTHFDTRLARHDVAGSRAHASELARVGLLDPATLEEVLAALDELDGLLARGEFDLEPTDEDVHGALERWLTERLGADAGRVRAGRSRNDQVVSDLRLWTRDAIDRTVADVGALQAALVARAEEHRSTLAPGYTHLQRAQPVLLAHWFLAWFWMLERDVARLTDARRRVDVSVLGSAALAGQTLGLDPEAYAAALGFAAVTDNSLDAVSSRDFVLEVLAASAILATTLSRLAEELVVWSTSEFGFARLSDGFTTGSSIMPQKRNPDVAELARGKAGRVIGSLVAVLTTVKGLPLSYDRDLQEDKEPLFDAIDTLGLVVPALTGAIASAVFDVERLARAASDPGGLATDLAEVLVRRGVPFARAHDLVGELVRLAEGSGRTIAELDADEAGALDPALDASALAVLDARSAVERREGRGGTGPASVARQLAAASAILDARSAATGSGDVWAAGSGSRASG
jgi:argininosuccinate lyase